MYHIFMHSFVALRTDFRPSAHAVAGDRTSKEKNMFRTLITNVYDGRLAPIAPLVGLVPEEHRGSPGDVPISPIRS